MIERRKFLGTALGGALAIPTLGFSATDKATPWHPERMFPKRLKKGDTIGLIAPGYAFKPHVLAETITTLESLGFKTRNTDRLIGNYGYLSNTDKERAADLNEMFCDPEIDGILCVRGGYGCTRIMSMIDYEGIKENPKALIGFSDITALLNGIYKETGLVTFHGPVGSTLDDPYCIDMLQKVVMNPTPQFTIENVTLTNPKYTKNVEYDRYAIVNGTATGRIVGGSLTLINALVGTPQEIDFTDALVFIEDIEEDPYRIDRMLTQLIEGPTFKKAAGFVLGVFAGCNSSSNPISFSLKEVVLDRIKPLGIPAVYGMSFGHVKNNFTFPVGVKATLDTAKMNVTLLEQAVL